jgi:UDP-N-acetylmuramoyl-tripeptide--D-alanyl-D-alanine ligase
MLALTAEEAGRALDRGPLRTAVVGVSTDTRSLKPGDLFIALRGERFDGHDYVRAALAAGACGAVVDREIWAEREPAGEVDVAREARAPVYAVDDTLAALAALARAVRRKSGVVVLAVTGSAGKTSTKDILGALVARVRRVVVTAANQNNEVGVPLTLVQIEPGTEAVIVEMGMRGRGQIAALAGVAEPDVGIITNVHPVHLELLGSLENIARAKAELISGLRAGGVGAVPLVCEPLESSLALAGRAVVRFATVGGLPCASGPADVLVSAEPEEGADTQVLRVRWPGGEATLEIPAVPRHTLENLAAAVAGCYAAGLPVAECLPGFLDSGPGKGRGEIVSLPGMCLIDDTYNANPAAVRAALDNLVRVASRLGGRPVAVLGDMRELGPEERLYHRQTGEYAAKVGVAVLWGVGPLSESTSEGFREAMGTRPAAQAGHVQSPADVQPVEASLRSNDVVLFKASRGVRLEQMAERIAEQARAGRWSGRSGEASGAATILRATTTGSRPQE